MSGKGEYVYEWPRPMLTVDVVVFSLDDSRGDAMVLLVKRGKAPFAGMWALPGGFVGIEEELKDAAARELEEETGLKGVELEQLRTVGTVGRDPRGRQITVVYMGIMEGDRAKVRGGDDASVARWFSVEEVPAEMAFDHIEILKYASERMKN